MMPTITDELNRNLTPMEMRTWCFRMMAQFDCKIVDKSDEDVMVWAGHIVAAATDMTVEEFLKSYTTTLWNTIYCPVLPWEDDPSEFWGWISTITHECEHVLQFRNDKIQFPYYYATDTAYRANKEADALSTGAELYMWRYCGRRINAKKKALKLIPYGCNPGDIAGAAASIDISQDMYEITGEPSFRTTKTAIFILKDIMKEES